MCLSVPGKIIEITPTDGLRMCKIDFGGVIQEACIEACPDAQLGDWAIVHAGFVLNLLSEEQAQDSLEIWKEIAKQDNYELSG